MDVPKEVCARARRNPRKVKRPVIKKWCYTPTTEGSEPDQSSSTDTGSIDTGSTNTSSTDDSTDDDLSTDDTDADDVSENIEQEENLEEDVSTVQEAVEPLGRGK